MKSIIQKIVILSSLFFFPIYLVLADTPNLGDIFTKIINTIITPLIPLLIGLGLVAFFWGLIKYFTSIENDEEKKKARSLIIYGVIILFVMVSVWGLVNILKNTFFSEGGLDPDSIPQFFWFDTLEPGGPGDIFYEPII